MAMAAMDRSVHVSLREEVQMLRRKVVKLETAAADNERLKKDMSKMEKTHQEEKAQRELDFMNQITQVARENALKNEELEGRLTESSKVNRALSEQLVDSQTQEMFSKKIRDMEKSHKKEIVNIVENNRAERDAMHNQLKIVQEAREELTTKLDDAKLAVQMKQKEVDLLKQKEVESLKQAAATIEGREPPATGSIQRLLKKAHEDNAKLKNTIKNLETEASQKQELHKKEMSAMEERLASRDSELKIKVDEIKRLEMDLAKEKRGSKGSCSEESSVSNLKVLQQENMDLKRAIQNAESEKKRQEMSVMQLEKVNSDLKATNQRLETENSSLEDSLSRTKFQNTDSQNTATQRNRETPKVVTEPTPQTSQKSIYENRTTQIIRQLEQNLKKEGKMKQTMTAGLKIRKHRSEPVPAKGNVNPSQEVSKGEAEELQKQLEHERTVTANLRREIQDLKAILQRPSPSNVAKPSVTAEKERGRASLGQRRPTSDLSVISSQDASVASEAARATMNKPGPRTPVRGLVQSFERRISKRTVSSPKNSFFEPPSIRRVPIEGPGNTVSQLRSTFEANEIEDLKDALYFERQAVFELEDELTRQCEINCDLLREISSLTSETESSRNMNARQFETRCIADQREIEMLFSEIARLKYQLAEAEESKSTLSRKLQSKAATERLEIERLQDELLAMKAKVATAEESRSMLSKQMEKGAYTDKQEIDRLKLKIREVQSALNDAEQTIRTLEAQCKSKDSDLQERIQRIETLENSLREENVESTSQKTRVEALEKEVSVAKNVASELESKQHEIDGLNSLVNELQSNLADADETKRALSKEKEASDLLESLVQELRQQLSQAEDKCETLTKDRVNQSQVDEAKIDLLQAQVDDLAKKLADVTASKDELEKNERIHQDKFEVLQTQVEEKVKEFEETHFADREAIGRLREQVQALQQELSDSLDLIEKLQKQLQKRDEVEETVEELARQNQQSLDSQINKLQKELTKIQVESSSAEEDYKKKIQGLEEMVESMQSEVDERMGEKESEVADLKRRMENKDTFIGRLTKEKEQLVLSMNDMTSSRRSEIDELQSELMEMSTRSANQAREVQTLKLRLEESSYRKDEVDRLRTRVVELGDQLRAKDGSRHHETTALEVENSDLRQRLRQASLERQAAEDKLREYVEEHQGGTSRSVQVLRERNSALKTEVEKLNRKLKKLYAAEQRRQSSDSKSSVESSTRQSKSSVESMRLMI